jgi:hypothetical protein
MASAFDSLYELLRNEKAMAAKHGLTLEKNLNSILLKLRHPEIYKFLLKSFASRKAQVIGSLYKLIKELGGFYEKKEEFLKHDISSNLVRVFKTSSDDFTLRTETLHFLNIFCDDMPEICD